MKKFNLILLLIALLAIMSPLTINAAESGTCGLYGDNLTWTLDDNGTLTISGTGEMEIYDMNFKSAPWKSYSDNIKEVNISNGVTSTDRAAFSNCSNLTSVTLPDSITSISSFAFNDCISLTSITIPDSVTSIEQAAFSNCRNLANITIPDSVTSIGYAAFLDNETLTNIIIPDNVSIIDGNGFAGCHNLSSITIPNSMTFIGGWAFSWCGNLKNVTYFGTEEEWNKIIINQGNDDLLNANIEFTPLVNVLLNNAPLEFDAKPRIKNDRTMVPLRAIFEALGATVDWNAETRTVTSKKDGTEISLTVDSDIMYVNGSAVTLDAPAYITEDRTLVPVRAISEAFGVNVGWDGETRTVYLN